MKKVFLGGASALAFLALSGTAQAQSLSDTIGANIIGLQGSFANGNWVNESINVGVVNSSVLLSGLGTSDTVAVVDLGGISLDAEAAAALALALGLDLEGLLDLVAEGGLGAALGLAAQLGVDIDLGGSSLNTQLGGVIASTDMISTLAVGAVNTGDIASSTAAASGATSSSSFNQSIGAVESSSSAASSAANTSNTAASAAASQASFSAGPVLTTAISEAANFSASGPLTDVFASNRAYNIAAINSSVTGLANEIDLDGIDTLAVGAVNTGRISVGFDGSGIIPAGALDDIE